MYETCRAAFLLCIAIVVFPCCTNASLGASSDLGGEPRFSGMDRNWSDRAENLDGGSKSNDYVYAESDLSAVVDATSEFEFDSWRTDLGVDDRGDASLDRFYVDAALEVFSDDGRADLLSDLGAEDVYVPFHSTIDVLAARVFAGYGATFVTARDGSFWGWGNNLSGTFQPIGPATTFEDVRTRPQRISEHLPVREFHLYTPCVLVGEEGAGSVYCWGWGARDDFRTTEAGFRDPWEVWQFPRRMGDYTDVVHLNYGRCTRSDHSVWLFDGLDADWRMLTGLAPGHMIRGLESGIMWTDEGVQALDHHYYFDTVLHRIPGIVDAVDFRDHSCLLLNTGRVMCWGKNNAGQAGNFDRSEVCIYTPAGPVAGRTNCIRQPTEIEGLTDVVKIAVGKWRSCALRREGTVWCWGDNEVLTDGLGILGDGRPPDEQCVPFAMEDGGRVEYPGSAIACRKQPAQVPGITDAVDLSVGFDQSCVVRATGQVLCWGDNSYGSLGGGTTDHGTPTPVRWY